MGAFAALAMLAGGPGQVTDEDIHAWLAAGRFRQAFEVLLPRYRDRVFRLSYSILRDRASAEDAAQDTFLNVWRALPGYNGSAALGTWIYAIARNTALMELRRRRPHVSLDGDDPESVAVAASLQGDGGAGPDAHGVERLLDSLPESQRRAVTLFYLEDKSYEAVSDALGMPLGTVKNLLHRARKRLALGAGVLTEASA